MNSAALRSQLETTLIHRVPGVFSPKNRVAPELWATRVGAVDELTGGGVPRGAITEISGPVSSGRTALVLSILAEGTRRGACAWVDVHDALDPESAAAAGIDLKRLLWVRAGKPVVRKNEKPWSRLDQALKATDLLLQAGGFGVIVLDMSDVLPEHALRVPLASWYRFRLATEQASCALVLLTQTPCAKSSSALLLRCERAEFAPWSQCDEVSLFERMHCRILLERKRGDAATAFPKRCPRRDATWTGKTLWSR